MRVTKLKPFQGRGTRARLPRLIRPFGRACSLLWLLRKVQFSRLFRPASLLIPHLPHKTRRPDRWLRAPLITIPSQPAQSQEQDESHDTTHSLHPHQASVAATAEYLSSHPESIKMQRGFCAVYEGMDFLCWILAERIGCALPADGDK